ncbi:AGAP005594-PA [Anopheles gambiae str. PEST]|uniref:AGAP005594-PA n=1 Tax=Anopheles gambiae TaxID=7165 RepID=Q7Q6Z4_ANOGA|nr:AGAP005594-PA [Anopheles gambiae str. PEST]
MGSAAIVCFVIGVVGVFANTSAALDVIKVNPMSDETPEGFKTMSAGTVVPYTYSATYWYGYNAYAGQFPYHAEINFYTNNYLYKRAGALITLNYVITPASSFHHYFIHGDMLYGYITLGSVFNSTTQWEQTINYTESSIVMHPFFHYTNEDYYNIAIIRLDRPAIQTRYVKPIRLPKLSDTRTYLAMEGTSCGTTKEEGLSYLRNPLLSLSICRQQLTSYTFHDQHYCTDVYRGGSFCNRQCGSSLTVEDENGPVLIGVVDLLFQCSYSYPVRYVRLSAFREWIQLSSDYRFDY